MSGFGRSRFGLGPFGRADIGRDLIIEPFPEEYFDDSLVLESGETIKNNNKDPLLKFLDVYANSVLQRKMEIERLPLIIDYESASLDVVRLLGEMLGLDIDKNDPEFLQRSLLGNASQWLQIKSSRQGYRVRGLASGFDVAITNYWRIDPSYLSFIPARHTFMLKPKSADASAIRVLHTDVPPGTYLGTPLTEDPTYAKASYITVVFTVAEPRRDFVDYNKLLDLVIAKIFDVAAIHHELLPPQFLIEMNVHVGESVSMTQYEQSGFNANESTLFDLTPADTIPVDSGGISVGISQLVTYAWPTGTDGPLNVPSGSVTLPAGSVKNYSSINIAAGASLIIDNSGSGSPWTIIGCLGNCVIDGSILAKNGEHTGGTFTATAPDGRSLSYLIAQAAGGVGGNGGTGLSPQVGGASAFGNGGGGAGAFGAGVAAITSKGGNGGPGTGLVVGIGANVYAGTGGAGGGGPHYYGGGGGSRGRHGQGIYLSVLGNLSGSGLVDVSGGAGGGGGNGPSGLIGGSSSGGGGGAAGGSGGKVVLRYVSRTDSIVFAVAAGTGGVGGTAGQNTFGTATAGSSGSSGSTGSTDIAPQ
jgi:hypothetical protein